MKAAVHYQYGQPNVIIVKELQNPTPKENEILVKIKAATVNRTDCAMLTASAFVMRLITGLTKPRNPISGTDFAGEIIEIGKKVEKFKVGDRIFGIDDNGLSSHAEILTISGKNAIGIIPEKISYEKAAASIEGLHYAINFVNKVNLQPGDKVLVNGATGTIGSSTLQLCKYYGATITAVCENKYEDQIKTLGAEKVIDFTREDFTHIDDRFDYVFDAVGKSSFSACKKILKKKGIYISSELGQKNENPFLALTTKFSNGKKVKFPFPFDRQASVDFTAKILQEGKFDPLIDRKYNLDEIVEAFTYVISGKKIGNVLIVMNDE